MNIERILLYILVIYIVIDASRNNFFKSTIKNLLQVVFSGKKLKENNSHEENFQEEDLHLIEDLHKQKNKRKNKQKNKNKKKNKHNQKSQNKNNLIKEEAQEDTSENILDVLDDDDIVNTYVYFVISINNDIIGKIVIKLYDDIAPITCKNFRELVCRSPVVDMENESAYKECQFHRIIKGFMIQTGDFVNNDGTGGVSIYGETFDDETFEVKHNKSGIVSMANSGKNTNGSQFFITTTATPHLDGKHVAFGEVIDGMDIVHIIENASTDQNNKPRDNIYIYDCGLIGLL